MIDLIASTSGASLVAAGSALVSAVVSTIGVVVLGVAVVVARKQVGEAVRLREEAVLLREGESRPFVVVEFDNSQRGALNLAVENIGRTMATDVQFQWDPPLESTLDHAGMGTSWVTSRPLPSLPPGRRLSSLFDITPVRFADQCTLADDYIVTIRYGSPLLPNRTFSEAIRLDLAVYRHLPRGEAKPDLVRVLEEIRDRLPSP